MSQADKPPWVNHFHFILPDPTQRRILLLPGAEGYALPYLRMTGVWLSSVKRIADALRAAYAFDFPFTILRYVAADVNESERWDRILFVLEPQQRIVDPPLSGKQGGEWIDSAALRDLPLAFPEQRAALLAYLEERAQGERSPNIHPRRSPWARPGWFAEAARWIEQAVAETGHSLIDGSLGRVEQLRNWSISTLLTAETTAGRVYFKAAVGGEPSGPLFVNEAALVQTLNDLFPGRVPRTLKIDRDRRWMLMPEFGPPLDSGADAGQQPAQADPLRAFGLLQRDSAHHIDALFAAACIDRRLPVLAAQIDDLFADPLTHAYMDAADVQELIAFAPLLKQRCAEVAASNLPSTLLHGDLHLGNVTRSATGDDFLFFDWTDAAIGFPFLDHFLLYFAGSEAGANEAERIQARDAYLAAWEEYESPARLRELWTRAKPLCALHHAVSYQYLVNSLEPHTRGELFHGLTENLQNLLAALRAEITQAS